MTGIMHQSKKTPSKLHAIQHIKIPKSYRQKSMTAENIQNTKDL